MAVALAVPGWHDGGATLAQQSFLGGAPHYLDGVARPAPRCGVCGDALPLIAQLYAPVHGARALHVFGCARCSRDDRAWAVRRTQERAETTAAAPAAPPPPPAEPARWASADDWGVDDDDDDVDLEALLRQHEAGPAAPAAPPPPAKAAAAPEAAPEAAPAAASFPRRALAWVDEPGGAAAPVDSDDDDDGAAGGDDAAMLRRAAAYLDGGGDDDAARAAVRAAVGGGGAAAASAAPSDDAYEAAPSDDVAQLRFNHRLARKPAQVARYDYGGAPLWPAAAAPASARACACGAPRRFEVQLLPTLIATLRSDDLDFRCVAVFSCADSCAASDAEVAFVEPAPSLQDLRDN